MPSHSHTLALSHPHNPPRMLSSSNHGSCLTPCSTVHRPAPSPTFAAAVPATQCHSAKPPHRINGITLTHRHTAIARPPPHRIHQSGGGGCGRFAGVSVRRRGGLAAWWWCGGGWQWRCDGMVVACAISVWWCGGVAVWWRWGGVTGQHRHHQPQPQHRHPDCLRCVELGHDSNHCSPGWRHAPQPVYTLTVSVTRPPLRGAPATTHKGCSRMCTAHPSLRQQSLVVPPRNSSAT